jgi:hypothetical protein
MVAKRRIVAGLIGLAIVACSSGPSVVDPLTSTTPSAAFSVEPSVEPTPAATPGVRDCIDGLPYNPGRYRMDARDTQTVPLSVTMTEGWRGCGLAFKELGPPAGLMMVGFWDGRNVYRNPCHWRDSRPDPAVGPTVADLATALVDQELTVAEPADPVTIDGFSGLHVRFKVPVELDTSACDAEEGAAEGGAEFRFLDGPGDSVWWLGASDAPGLIGQVWILEVRQRRVVLQTAAFVDAGEARQAELAGIVSSIEFER